MTERPITFTAFGKTRNGVLVIDPARKRIQLMCEEEDMPGVLLPYATCTTAVAGLEADEWAIKNWSENEGMLDRLVEAGVVNHPHRFVRSGWVMVPVCTLKEG